MFLHNRVWCLLDNARYEEAFLWSARALQFSPDDPVFPAIALMVAETALKHRLRRKYPDRKIPPCDAEEPFIFNPGEVLAREERSLFITIVAHHKELLGEIDAARTMYEEACRQNFHGNNEQRDLQRFLHKFGLKRKPGPLLPPKELGFPRRFKVSCQPHEEADALRQIANEFERSGELRKARDALHDLYMFDPCDASVFQRARGIEKHPVFQKQLKAVYEKKRELVVHRAVDLASLPKSIRQANSN